MAEFEAYDKMVNGNYSNMTPEQKDKYTILQKKAFNEYSWQNPYGTGDLAGDVLASVFFVGLAGQTLNVTRRIIFGDKDDKNPPGGGGSGK